MIDYKDISDIKERNRQMGFHFFDAGALRFFRSRVSDTVYQGPGGIFIVTSEQFTLGEYAETRKYTPRKFDWETGSFEHFNGEPEFNTCSRDVAHRIARQAAEQAMGAVVAK
jgi:hypothetical protein